MRLGTLTSIGLLLPALTLAQDLRLEFVPESDAFTDAAAEYRSIWNADGARIVEVMERLTGLEFEAGPVAIVVYEGTSFSGYRDIPMRLRASYARSTKQATLVHELAHRLISELVPGTFEDHPIIFLFVYDAWVGLWGSEFANREVAVESARRGPSDYAGTWRRVLALTVGERAEQFGQFLKDHPQRH
jgi:hypothetical protein